MFHLSINQNEDERRMWRGIHQDYAHIEFGNFFSILKLDGNTVRNIISDMIGL